MKTFTLSYFHLTEGILVETVYMAGQAIPAIVLGNRWSGVNFVPVKLTPKSYSLWEKEKTIWICRACAGLSERFRNLHIHDWSVYERDDESAHTYALVVCRDGYRYGSGVIWEMSEVFDDRLHEVTSSCREELISNPEVQEWFERKKKGPHFPYDSVKDYVYAFATPIVVGTPPMEVVGDSHPHLPLESDFENHLSRQIAFKVMPGHEWAIATGRTNKSKLPEASLYHFDGEKITEEVMAKSWHRPKKRAKLEVGGRTK